jgi:hypothetical protein
MNNQSEYDFTLPRGYTDAGGTVHREGKMRLAEAIDEIESLNNPMANANEAYLPVVLFSRVVTRLGNLQAVTPQVIERLYVADFTYLEDLYMRINSKENITLAASCPNCNTQFQLQVAPLSNTENF